VPTIEIIIFLLIVAAGLELLSRRINVPRPILLVIAGTLLALVPAAPYVQLAPVVVLFIFLPPLLYWSAINTSWREFRQNSIDITLLAVGLVIVTATVVATVAHMLCPPISWPAAFALGAAVGPTDAVAATSVMRRFGVPRRLVSILEGESLVNDATSFVIFEMALVASDTGHFSLAPALESFLWSAGGGIAVGIAAGWCIAQLRRWLGTASAQSSVVESSISLMTPYVAFVAADRIGVSGVLAVVTVGLYLGHSAPRLLSASARIQAINMWEVLDFLLEGILFILVGLGMPLALSAVGAPGETGPFSLTTAAIAVSAAVIVLRIVWVFPAGYIPRYLRRHLDDRMRGMPYPPVGNVFFVGWAGLRGAVSLVLALSIPFTTADGAPFPGRDVVIFLTFVVILVTLVGQGLTLRPLIAWLGLEPDRAEVEEETEARLQTARAALTRLDDMGSDNTQSSADDHGDAPEAPVDPEIRQVTEQLYDRYTHRIHQYSSETHRGAAARLEGSIAAEDLEAEAREADADIRRADSYQRLRLAMIAAERQELIRLRDEGRIGDGVLHRIERDLDLEQILLTGGSVRG
jgi:CPA1 family monovalent cation:H+ antiporter